MSDKASQNQDQNNNQLKKVLEMDTVMGAVSSLASKAPSHKHLFLSDLEWLCLPPVSLRQFKLFRQKDSHIPMAYISWAKITPEIEKRLLSGTVKLAPREWNSGEKIFIIDVLSPFSPAHHFLNQILENDFKDQDVYLVQQKKNSREFESKLLKDILKEEKIKVNQKKSSQ